jgi:hypothetical protein
MDWPRFGKRRGTHDDETRSADRGGGRSSWNRDGSRRDAVEEITMTSHEPHLAGLAEADRLERRQRMLLWAAAGVESILIASFLLLADFSNRTHVLLFISAMVIYSMVGLGVGALAMRIEHGNRRVIEALRLASKL